MSYQHLVNHFPQADPALLAAGYDMGLHDAYELLRAKVDELGKEKVAQVLLLDDLAAHILRLRRVGDGGTGKDRA